MKVLLLGGSNAGVYFGWAAQFRALASRHEVENRFLGAVGSLYGLLRLLETAEDGASSPDLVVFEYALNDMVLLDAGFASMRLLRDALSDVVDFCARRNIRLLFLCLELRPSKRARVRSCVRRVERLYARIARASGAARLALDDIFETVRPDMFVDEHHLNEAASKRIAERLVEAVETVPVPVSGAAAARFAFVPASAARTEGPCRTIEVESSVFEGPFLEIARSGVSRWPGRGRLVGLMLRSTDAAGVYRIGAGAAAYRKTAQTKMREIVPKLILLHYSTRRPFVADDLEISMPENERELEKFPEDRSLLPAASRTPFAEQVLEIHSVVLWRDAGRRRGLRPFVETIGKWLAERRVRH